VHHRWRRANCGSYNNHNPGSAAALASRKRRAAPDRVGDATGGRSALPDPTEAPCSWCRRGLIPSRTRALRNQGRGRKCPSPRLSWASA